MLPGVYTVATLFDQEKRTRYVGISCIDRTSLVENGENKVGQTL